MFAKYFKNFALSPEQVTNSLKTMLACLIGMIINYFLNFSLPQWILICILMVMASNVRVGTILKRSYLRLLGTLIGVILSIITILLAKDHTIYIYISLLILIGIFTYFASSPSDNSYFGLLGAVTIVIILYVQHPTLKSAGERALENIMGILVAVLVTRLVFPHHAKNLLKKNIADTLQNLKTLMQIFVMDQPQVTQLEAQEKIETTVIQNFTKQTQLLKEAVTEDSKIKQKRVIYENIVLAQRKIWRSLYMLRQTLVQDQMQMFIQQNPHFQTLNTQILTVLDQLSAAILNGKDAHASIFQPINALCLEAKQVVAEVGKEHPFESKIKLHAFLFCIDHLIEVLDELTGYIRQLSDC